MAVKVIPLAVRRWQDSIKSGAVLTVWVAAEASEAALQAGHTAVAIDIAREAVALVRDEIAAYGKTPERRRDLSISMERLGNIAQALGRLDEAQTAYAEKISIARELLDAYGDSVPALDVMRVWRTGLG